MENKLPDDQLESFLRNSFKNYSEKPSEDVWDKIDFTLTSQTASKPSKTRRIWTVAAAAAILMIVYLGATNIYLHQKLNSIEKYNTASQKVNKIMNVAPSDASVVTPGPQVTGDHPSTMSQPSNTASESSEKNSENKKNAGVIESTENTSNAHVEKPYPSVNSTYSNRDKTIESQDHSIDPSKASDPLTHSISGKVEPKSKSLTIEKSHQPISKYKTIKVSKSVQGASEYVKSNNNYQETIGRSAIGLSEDKNKERSKGDKLNDLKENSTAHADHETGISIQRHAAMALEQIPTGINAVSYPSKNIFAAVFSDMIPAVIPSGKRWSELGLFGGIIHQSGSLTVEHRFGAAQLNTFHSTHSLYSGIGYSLGLNKHWYLSSGIGYKYYELVNNVNQTLVFKDRLNPIPGSMPFLHDWDYKLRCPGGTSDITIQSEQLDSRAVINDNETIPVHITNHEVLGYLTIPLSFNYRTSKGKFSFSAGAGADLNLLTNVKFEAPTININHPQLIARREPKESRIDKSNKAVWNGLISAGVAYSIAPRINLHITPSWYIPITNKFSDRDVKLKSTSYGIQLGLNYSIASL